ncbi:MAG: hypothetical protein IT320_19190 [Anaerolineae bacterium]|nr:hypothetical protein [Anaerolineae bacterium]
MNIRDRQLATAIIWFGLFLGLGFAIPRLMDMQIDLSGLWPRGSEGFSGQMTDINIIADALQSAQAKLPEVMAQAQAAAAHQIASNMPLAIFISILLILAAGAATWFIWRHAGLEAKLAADLLTFEKAKRRNRIERFVDDLDLDELDDLRARLGYEADDVNWQRSGSDGL